MMRRSRQRGVPVITVDDDVIVGFDRPRLEQAISRASGTAGAAGRVRLGAAIADASRVARAGSAAGAYVGKVTPGTAADRAGLATGDVIVAVEDRPVRTAAGVEQALASLHPGTAATFEVIRNGASLRLPIRF
jgi:S1-C subfamily serine protease